MRFITFNSLVKDYLEFVPLRPVTKKQTTYHLKGLLENFGRRKVTGITGRDLSGYVEKEIKRNMAFSTIATRVRIFKAVIHWGIRSGRIDYCQIDNFKLPKSSTRQIIPPNSFELKAMLYNCPSHIERTILLGWQFGPRIGPSELFALKWDDIDLQHGILHMPNACKGARNDYRILSIPDTLLSRMKKWKEKSESEWIINWQGKPVKHINRAFETARKKACIKHKFTPYSLRHAFATQAIANGAPLKGVCAVMGHASPRMVLEVYQHINFDLIKTTIRKVTKL